LERRVRAPPAGVKPPRWRRLAPLIVAAALVLAYALWSPGREVADGRHDRGRNALWLQHGWLGDDAWFARNRRDPARFRSREAVAALAARLRAHGVTDVFPHLCPVDGDGGPAHTDDAQVERFLDGMDGVRVMPWVGGVFERHVFPDDPGFRRRFAAKVRRLLDAHPRLAGVHVNVEPWPSGHAGMLALLAELRAQMPAGAVLSVAAYPPPTRWQPDTEIHWDLAYMARVAQASDQLAVMMYDTSIVLPKAYESLMARWTREALDATRGRALLLGLPAYTDEGVGWHRPWVEDLPHALRGIHAGLPDRLPAQYQGVAVYAEWEMDEGEWATLRRGFLRGR